jgi:hypothetical protein
MQADGDPQTYEVALEGGTLRRGFWLYVWEVTTPDQQKLLYVGRTGDSSSPKAASPFNRMGQHLGSIEASNMLRKHLNKRGMTPEDCVFRFVAHGPILTEVKDWDGHVSRRDIVGGLEQKLEQELRRADWDVMNMVPGTFALDEQLWKDVRQVFAERFEMGPELK